MRNKIGNLQKNRQLGQSLVGVVIATLILSLVSIAVLSSMGIASKSSRNAEPRSIGQTAVSNAQTDLNAITMYDSSSLSRISSGQVITIPGPGANGNYTEPSLTKPTTLTINRVVKTGTSADLSVNYTVPTETGTGLSGNSTISVFEKAPNLNSLGVSCDPTLYGRVAGC